MTTDFSAGQLLVDTEYIIKQNTKMNVNLKSLNIKIRE